MSIEPEPAEQASRRWDEASAVRAVEPWLVGGSEAFRAFASELVQVAASDVTVLVEGESGSGKGMAARALHGLSARSRGPLVEVGLAALAPTLIEAELFGHEEGAFTGAGRARVGRFRRADGGTLVLDGVETLTSEVQVKLLRALQERTISPLGSAEEIPVDARVVATSSRDLRAAVRGGRFREDLYYRLAVVTLRVPPLRSRLDDLPALAGHLMARLGERAGAPSRPLGAEALARLAAHAWPGNVRELENALERVMVLVPAGSGNGAPPPVDASELAFLDEAVAGTAERIAGEVLAHGVGIEDLDRAVLLRALEEQRGNASAAARQVGLTRRTFEYRLARLSGEEAGGDA